MKKWNMPEVTTVNISETAKPKPACYEDNGHGTCKYWDNGNNGVACCSHSGVCKNPQMCINFDPSEKLS